MKRKGFTITEIVVGAAILAVVMGLVMSLLIRSLDCAARVLTRAGSAQGRAVLSRMLQLDLAAAEPGSVSVNGNQVSLMRARSDGPAQEVVYHFVPEKREWFRKVGSNPAERIAHNFAGAFSAKVEGGQLRVEIDQPEAFALTTQSRLAGKYDSVVPADGVVN